MKKIVIASLFTIAAVSANAALVGYWNFDNDDLVESSGFTAAGTHDGVATVDGNTPAFTDGHVGGGVDYGRALDVQAGGAVTVLNSNADLNGSVGDGGVNSSYVGTFDAGLTNAMTIALWVQGQPGRWSPFIAQGGEDDGLGYQLRTMNRGPNIGLTLRSTDGGDDLQGGSTSWNDEGGWHHLAATWDTTTGNRLFYIDGVLDAGASITDGSDTGNVGAAVNNFLIFGSRDSKGDAIGGGQPVQLDEIRIYDNALSESEIQTLAIPEPGTLGLMGVFGGGLLFFRRRLKR